MIALDPIVAADIPAPGPLDEFTQARLRSMLITFFGDFPTLDAHLDLLDTRGAWYAERAVGSWSHRQPDSFFGLVRHVVRTQLGGPTPQPDVESWLAAGRPGDPELADLWDHIRALAAQGGLTVPDGDRGSVTADDDAIAAAETLDGVLTEWPAEHLEEFLLAYVKLEIVLERRGITLPPIGR